MSANDEEPTARQRLASAMKEKAAKAEAHDAWFRTKVEEALVDTRPSLANEEVKVRFAARRAATFQIRGQG